MMIQYDPTNIYEQNAAKGGVNQIKQFSVLIAAGAAVTDLVALIASREIKLLTLNAYAATATVEFNLQSNGVISFADWAVYQIRNYWSEPLVGIVNSVLSQPLRAQVGAASAIRFSGRYIEIVP